MKNFFLLFILIVVSCKSVDNTDNASKKIAVNIPLSTEESVGDLMKFLASDELQGRNTGTIGIELAADHIEGIFTKHGVKPYFEYYKDTLQRMSNAFNVVGYLEGTDPVLKNEFIIIGAHYDHIGVVKPVENDSIANGANDNATGTTAVVELAKYFGRAKTNKRSLLFVLFTAEEMGLVGAKDLAKRLKEDNFSMYTMVNFEMIGVPMTSTYKAYLTGFKMSNMAQKINEYAGKELVGFLPQAEEYQLFKRSDNYSFFEEFKLPAQTISTFDFTNYEYYHHVKDEVQFMDFGFMSTLINDMIPVIEKMAGTSDKEIKMY